jgi:multidrug efflux pump subunit AcrA (membrane-fusion protein)
MHTVTITEPCRVHGQHRAAGDVLPDLDDQIAFDIVASGRGTIDPARAKIAVDNAAQEKASAKAAAKAAATAATELAAA